MVFSSLTFICIFLPVVFLACLVLPGVKLKNYLLIFASLIFYAFGEPVYVMLMLVSSVMNYVFARVMERLKPVQVKAAELSANTGSTNSETAEHTSISSPRSPKAKALVVVAIVVNLAFLGFFKYAGMFVSTAEGMLGVVWEIPVIALPIGISFYTFQAMSYVIDVYRGKVEASKSFTKVLLYISFFPQLIAGPIIQYHDVDAQLSNRRMTPEGVAKGLRRFAVGLAKKVLIANTMAVAVDAIYGAELSEVTMAAAWVGALAYIMQIYFDFSGYSDMAIGLAQVFGFKYKENFNYPYISSSIQEFWRRWHISLSNWFKEYLYIPLGGNRKGKLRAGINKIIVFFFCGLWHGASWTFVVWGLFHGFFLLLENLIPVKKLPKALGVVYALLVVTVGFVLFRAETFEQAAHFITQMFTGFSSLSLVSTLALEQLTPLFIFTFVCAVFACIPWRTLFTRRLGLFAVPTAEESALPNSSIARIINTASFIAALVLLIVCLLSLSGGGYNPFIYFRF